MWSDVNIMHGVISATCSSDICTAAFAAGGLASVLFSAILALLIYKEHNKSSKSLSSFNKDDTAKKVKQWAKWWASKCFLCLEKVHVCSVVQLPQDGRHAPLKQEPHAQRDHRPQSAVAEYLLVLKDSLFQ